ncbi:MAG: heme ABC exporter ATP-binding protein CcmA [Chloroflexi bacterium]|nr:heme ABC exporter ATP-binding protein CcmA [Chloroflexota bacterium]
MSDQPIIETRNLVKVYGLLPVLRKLNLSIDTGQFVALLGPNGSGKSTLLRLLAGLTRPTSGTILVGGWELPRQAAAVRAQIGLVSHRVLLYENLTARENLRFFARLYALPAESSEDRINSMIERVGLRKRADGLVRTFSRGMQQRLSIARALLHDPHVLLLDEPYTGLDQDAAAVLDELVQEAQAGGHTLLMATHQLDRAARLAQRVIILSRGSIGYDADATALDGPTLAATYAEVTGTITARP